MVDEADTLRNVLFLCTGNSARSILAEAIMNRVGAPRFKAYSAGSMPKGAVHPGALATLRRHGFSADGYRSKSWEEFAASDAPKMDFVFTVCDNAAAELCPIWPGRPISAHWGVPDPAEAVGNDAEVALVFADTFRMLSSRIGVFVNLPMASLDRLSLRKRLDEIGKMSDETQPA